MCTWLHTSAYTLLSKSREEGPGSRGSLGPGSALIRAGPVPLPHQVASTKAQRGHHGSHLPPGHAFLPLTSHLAQLRGSPPSLRA